MEFIIVHIVNPWIIKNIQPLKCKLAEHSWHGHKLPVSKTERRCQLMLHCSSCPSMLCFLYVFQSIMRFEFASSLISFCMAITGENIKKYNFLWRYSFVFHFVGKSTSKTGTDHCQIVYLAWCRNIIKLRGHFRQKKPPSQGCHHWSYFVASIILIINPFIAHLSKAISSL